MPGKRCPDHAQFTGGAVLPRRTCYEYAPELRRSLCAARRRKHLEGFVHRAKLLRARRTVPFAGNFALLAEDQQWMNEKQDNNFNTPDEAIALLAEKAPEIEGLQMNPGDRWTPSAGLTRLHPAPDFGRKSEQVREMASQWQPRLDALRDAEPPARSTLRRDFEAYFRRIADNHPELCTRIGSRVVFDAEGEHGGVWCLHFADRRLRVSEFRDGDPWEMRMTLPAGILQRVLDDQICWDEVCISFRVQFRENPEYFNQDFWAMLYNNSRAFLDEYLGNPDPKYS